ncbi:MAG: hypothetical protein JSV65_15470 [Armatimonadota bacterium]|nr:MAG: hypothetical protein JSV65_15470 [Armatimonadota bacterium]
MPSDAGDCAVIVTDHSRLPYAELVAHSRMIRDVCSGLRVYFEDSIVQL